MKKIQIINDREHPLDQMPFMEDGPGKQELLDEVLYWEIFNLDMVTGKGQRYARRIIGEYAVTELPFMLLLEDDEVYAALYSEEGPITIERINEKL